MRSHEIILRSPATGPPSERRVLLLALSRIIRADLCLLYIKLLEDGQGKLDDVIYLLNMYNTGDLQRVVSTLYNLPYLKIVLKSASVGKES